MTTTASTRTDPGTTPPGLPRARPPPPRYAPTVGFVIAWSLWALTAGVTLWMPDALDVEEPLAAGAIFALWTLLLAGWATYAYWNRTATERLRHWTPWIGAGAGWVLIWEFTTAKTGWLVPPHFASPPQQMLAVFVSDAGILASSTWHSLLLLLIGFTVGALAGLGTGGIALGWSKLASYWGAIPFCRRSARYPQQHCCRWCSSCFPPPTAGASSWSHSGGCGFPSPS